MHPQTPNFHKWRRHGLKKNLLNEFEFRYFKDGPSGFRSNVHYSDKIIIQFYVLITGVK